MEPSNIFGDQDDIFKHILQIYQRSEESLLDDVNTLKKWMKTQPHLPEILDDKSIQNFLFLNKCSIEKSKQKIDMYYTLRSQIPDFYAHVNPRNANIQRALEVGCWIPFPKLTEEKYRVVCFKIQNKNLAEMLDLVDIVALALVLYEVRLKEDTLFRDIIIFDGEKTGFSLVKKMTPSILAKIFTIAEKVYSTPLKKIFLVNSSPLVDTALKLLKIVMKPKLFDRVFVCQDVNILKEHFSEEILPRDYGGKEKSLQELKDMLMLKFVQYQNRFDELDKLRVDESLRPEQLRNDEVLGFHGNFKTLNVD